MKFERYPSRNAMRNYFPLPNEIFSLGLSAGEIATYAYLMRCEDRKTYQCYPSYETIGEAIGKSRNTVMKYVHGLEEKHLIYTEPTTVWGEGGLKRNGTVWSDFFYTELTTGMRRGEICGLRWQDFDEKTGRLQIRRAVTSKKGGGVKVGETKTEKGTRTIQLPPSTVEILKARKKKSCSEWIFHNPTVPELPLSPETAYRRMKTLLRYAQLLPIRFHDLRHTFATHALTSGVDAKTLSGMVVDYTKVRYPTVCAVGWCILWSFCWF